MNYKHLLIALLIIITILIIFLFFYQNERTNLKPATTYYSEKKYKIIVLNEWGSDPKPIKSIFVDINTYEILSKNKHMYVLNLEPFLLKDGVYVYFLGGDGIANDFSLACTSKGIGTLICRKDWSIDRYCRSFNRTNFPIDIKKHEVEKYVYNHLLIFFSHSGNISSVNTVSRDKKGFIIEQRNDGGIIRIPYNLVKDSNSTKSKSSLKEEYSKYFYGEMIIAVEYQNYYNRLFLYKVTFNVNKQGKISLTLKKLTDVHIR